MFNLIIGFILAIGVVMATEPKNLIAMDLEVYDGILALINITAFWFIGFIISVVLPDKYLDREFGLDDMLDGGEITAAEKASQAGQIAIARAIIIFALTTMYAGLMYIFFGG